MQGVGDESDTFSQALRRRMGSFFSNSAPETGGSDPSAITDDGMDTTLLTVGIVGVGLVGLGGLGWWFMRRRRAAAS